MPFWCLATTAAAISPSAVRAAACGVYLGSVFEMPLWLVCAVLFAVSLLPASRDHTSQQ